MRILVVDDSAFVRRALRKLLVGVPGVTAVDTAASADEALAQLDHTRPDLVTLDIDMPGMDGLRALRALLARRPKLRIVMLSALTRHGAEATLDALAAGAVDFIDKTSFSVMDLERLRREVLDKLRPWVSGDSVPPLLPSPPMARAAALQPPAHLDLARFDVCVVGASTGGPAALQALLSALPAAWPLPTVIAQHMPAGFTASFAARLSSLARVRVSEGHDGDALAPGLALVAPAGQQTRVRADGRLEVVPGLCGERHAPSIDRLMESAAASHPGRVLGVLLTGMGDDGASGLAVIRAGGGLTLAESEATCVVFGMPRAAFARGGVDHLLPLPAITRALAEARRRA